MSAQRRKVSLFGVIFFVVAGYFLYAIACKQVEIAQVRQEAREVEARLQKTTEENKNLLTEKKNLNSFDYIEKIAREQFGMVKPGEIPYVHEEK